MNSQTNDIGGVYSEKNSQMNNTGEEYSGMSSPTSDTGEEYSGMSSQTSDTGEVYGRKKSQTSTTGVTDNRMEGQWKGICDNPRKIFCIIGLSLLVAGLLPDVVRFLINVIVKWSGGSLESMRASSWFKWIYTFCPLYLVAIPVCLLLLRLIPPYRTTHASIGPGKLFSFLLMCFPIMFVGSLVGTLLSMILSGNQAQNALLDYALDDNPIKILVIAVLAPCIEEYVFRKRIIDSCSRYGEKTAVIFSAFCFGSFHMNLFQFFYAFGVGLLFAYVYAQTRKLRYSIILHMIINALGSVLVPMLLSDVDLAELSSIENMTPEAMTGMLPKLVPIILYEIVYFGFAVTGLVLLILNAKKISFRTAPEELPRNRVLSTVYGNVGVILLIALCILATIAALRR